MRWDIFAHTWDEDLADAMLGAARYGETLCLWDWGCTPQMASENMMHFFFTVNHSLGATRGTYGTIYFPRNATSSRKFKDVSAKPWIRGPSKDSASV